MTISTAVHMLMWITYDDTDNADKVTDDNDCVDDNEYVYKHEDENMYEDIYVCICIFMYTTTTVNKRKADYDTDKNCEDNDDETHVNVKTDMHRTGDRYKYAHATVDCTAVW